MKRRVFLSTSLVRGGLPVLPALAGSAPRAGFHLGCITFNLLKDYDLETIIRVLEGVGFEGVELRTSHKHGVEPSIGAEARTRVREKFERSRVRLVAYGTTCEFHSPNAAERKRQMEIGMQFVDLAHDTGAIGVKVRPNGMPEGVSPEQTIQHIGDSLRDLGDYGAKKGIQIWLEVHGRETSHPSVAAAIMKVAHHPQVGLCWNSNPEDIVNGSVKPSFDLLRPWVRHCHINELANDYPWRELFTLLRQTNYTGYTLCEAQANPETERFLRWYKALWTELCRPCG